MQSHLVLRLTPRDLHLAGPHQCPRPQEAGLYGGLTLASIHRIHNRCAVCTWQLASFWPRRCPRPQVAGPGLVFGGDPVLRSQLVLLVLRLTPRDGRRPRDLGRGERGGVRWARLPRLRAADEDEEGEDSAEHCDPRNNLGGLLVRVGRLHFAWPRECPRPQGAGSGLFCVEDLVLRSHSVLRLTPRDLHLAWLRRCPRLQQAGLNGA